VKYLPGILILFAMVPSGSCFADKAGATTSPLRCQVSLNQDWRFQRQITPGSAVEWQYRDAWKPEYDDSQWSRVFLPHSWDQTAHAPWVRALHWRGIGWYRKYFLVPQLFQGQRVFLEFEGALQVTKAWVNGRESGDHVGGYTGFVFDVTDSIKPGGNNLLAVRVDNTNSPDIPPAHETNISIYGGIYRDVWLHVTGPVFIPDGGVLINTPEVSRERSQIHVFTEVRNSLGSQINATVVSEVIAPGSEIAAKVEQQKDIPGN
jgi:beta-galactosidase